jgi:hypothetical protein
VVAATHDPKRESNDATTRATVPRMRCAIIIMMMAARRRTTRTALRPVMNTDKGTKVCFRHADATGKFTVPTFQICMDAILS